MSISLVWPEVGEVSCVFGQYLAVGTGFGVKEGETNTFAYSYMVCSSQLLDLRAMASVCRGLGE